MRFKIGKIVYTKIDKEECLYYLYKKYSIFVIQEKYETFLSQEVVTNKEGHIVDKLFFMNFGKMTVPITEDDNENEQVFYADLHFLKQMTGEYDINKYIFFACEEDNNG